MTSEGFVLDASVALSWCFEDESDSYADAVLEHLDEAHAWVPVVWSLEVTNALLVAERRRRLDTDRVDRVVRVLSELPIQQERHEGLASTKDLVHLARETGLSAYDASYVALARRLGVPLASLDRRMTEAARNQGLALLELT